MSNKQLVDRYDRLKGIVTSLQWREFVMFLQKEGDFYQSKSNTNLRHGEHTKAHEDLAVKDYIDHLSIAVQKYCAEIKRQKEEAV